MLQPGIDYLYSFQGDDGYGIIRRHPILRVSSTTVVIDECPIGLMWPSKAIELSRAELETTGETVINHEAYYVEPQDDWWEGWRFGEPPSGLIEAMSDPEVVDRIRQIVEAERRRKSAEQGHAKTN